MKLNRTLRVALFATLFGLLTLGSAASTFAWCPSCGL
jgi:hypothetical protein